MTLCRLERAVTKLPKKDLAAVRRRFAILEVIGASRHSNIAVCNVATALHTQHVYRALHAQPIARQAHAPVVAVSIVLAHR